VGTGIENPGRFGKFIFAKHKDGGLYVNLFVPSELKADKGVTLKQETNFPFEPRTELTWELDKPVSLALRIRHPWWVPDGEMTIRVNGEVTAEGSSSSSYAEVKRVWRSGEISELDQISF